MTGELWRAGIRLNKEVDQPKGVTGCVEFSDVIFNPLNQVITEKFTV